MRAPGVFGYVNGGDSGRWCLCFCREKKKALGGFVMIAVLGIKGYPIVEWVFGMNTAGLESSIGVTSLHKHIPLI
jgi:hypothetical protein